MRTLAALILLLAPAAAAAAHDGTIATRSHPEYSDLALAALAVVGVWVVRRALRKRFAPPPSQEPPAEH